jgi:regulator of replication initiation timing|tara:strand:+ start:429 stop:1391 length:963 start_codon:yes stop_codon:yes gene_type:complete
MKLGDFYDKKPVERVKNTQVFDLNNDHKEAILGAQIATLEDRIVEIDSINGEKSHLQSLLDNKTLANESLLGDNKTLNDRIDRLDAEVVEKHRIFEDMAVMKSNFDNMSSGWGELSANLNTVTAKSEGQEAELEQLRVNNANLQIKAASDYQDTLNKKTVETELKVALGNLQQEHQALTEFSKDLSTKYTESDAMTKKLDKDSLGLHNQLAMMTSIKNELEQKLLIRNQSGSTDAEKRVRTELSKQMADLMDDMTTIAIENKRLRADLSAPRPMSVGAIAKQEGFKVPLASSALNYRKNTLGNSKPTLIRFAHKEISNDN